MATMIDRMQVQALLAEGLSLREIARRLKIPWATFRRHWQQLQREASTPVNAQVTEMPERGRPPVVDLSPPTHQHMGLPAVHHDLPAELEGIRENLLEVAQWWRERKMRRVHPSGPRDTERWTVHVERQWIERVKEEADAEGVPIMAIVNRALRQYFEGR